MGTPDVQRPPDPSEPLELIVGPEAAGERLDVIVSSLSAVGSRARAAALIDQGNVAVDGRLRPKSFRPPPGACISVSLAQPTPTIPAAEDLPVDVVYEDRWLLVVDKPAGMVVHPAKGHGTGTLVNALLGHGIAGGEEFRPGVVHRLDRDTSGLLVVAKDPAVHRRLAQMIRDRQVDRRYLALVHGNLSEEQGTIDAPIGRDPVRRKSMSVGGVAEREAVTHFTVLERLGELTLLEVRLETGRTHQIRVHFLAIGHPVVGDPTYARRDVLGLGRQFLHSHRLTFVHPETGALVDLRASLPPDLAAALEQARRR